MFFPYLMILSSFRKVLTVFLSLFSRFSSSSSLTVSPPPDSFQPVLNPFSFHVFNCSTFHLTLPSLLCLRKAYVDGVLFNFLQKKGRGVRTCSWTHAAAATIFGKRKGHLPSLLALIYMGAGQGCSYPSFGLSWTGFYSNYPLGQASPPPSGFSLRLVGYILQFFLILVGQRLNFLSGFTKRMDLSAHTTPINSKIVNEN